ncbi:MAG: MaoC/PaaZ C-terminal domain-containing protein [Actinomycetota bacterium]|nr:MaoC/PaaZ C-terminal domain-containing protein [Actinomycetota bacterium]
MRPLHELGPLFEDFEIGGTIPALPPVTLTEADNALYRAITGDQHRFAADQAAYRAAGGEGSLANPGLVMQYSIGQTTNATRRAIANLYYRSVRVLQPVRLGQTLTTTATVLGLRDAAPKDGQHRGKVWLGIQSCTDDGPVVEYERCALVAGTVSPGHSSDIPGPSAPTPLADLVGAVPAWDLSGLAGVEWAVGETRTDPLRDHIDMAAPLARLTFNQAAVHRDHTLGPGGRRLVYGGHVQGLAQASLTRILPGLATVVAWDGCDHVGPAFEGDMLEFRHTLVERTPAGSGHLMRFEIIGARVNPDGSTADLLRWTLVAWAP